MSNFTPIQLEDFIRQQAPNVSNHIRTAAQKARNEADLVAEVEDLLDKLAKQFDIQLYPQQERTLINGRADAVYNRFVIEYEPPNSLRRTHLAPTNQHAIEQVQRYIQGLERLDRQSKDRLAGAVLDGSYFIFIRYRDERWFIDQPLEVTPHSTETFLRYLLSLSTEKALTPDRLVHDFGENSNTARHVVPLLYNAFATSNNAKVKVLFAQWQQQFHEVSGYDPSSGQLNVSQLGRSYGLRSVNDLDILFFVIHTYYATFIKLLALQVAQYYLMPKNGTDLAQSVGFHDDELRGFLVNLERGGLFTQLGINNFLEGDFFGWYLEIWDSKLANALRRLMGELANYSLVTLDVDPEETRDLLKKLYQNLMPRNLRHALGEYYTPDWLAERLLNQIGYRGDPAARLLDPACGSGTFLVLAIKRVRAFADDRSLKPPQVLEQILQNIVGFDLNPLAVISARTNYLLALGDLLSHQEGEINIPVYLADSILTPSMEVSEGGQLSFLSQGSTESTRQPGYSFNTAVGRFSVPSTLVTAGYIDQLANLLEESVRLQLSEKQFQDRLIQTFPLDEEVDAGEIQVAIRLYLQLLELEHQGINGIWARIIKNAFAPLFQGQFDYVAGNPPWVNWESLPENYRQATKFLWVQHGLFPHSGMDTILGKGKKDISMLMTYVALDNYLKRRGKLGFIITQSVLKTTGAGQGFRRFQLRDNTPIKVVNVDDMVRLKPFEGAANRTAIIILEKGTPTSYPVPYAYWYKKGGGTVIPEDVSLEQAAKIVSYYKFFAQPVDNNNLTSPWLSARKRALTALQKVTGKSDYQAHAGIYSGGANAVYWVEKVAERPDGLVVINNITEGAKRQVESVQTAIEPDLLFPLLRARDVRRWYAQPSAWIIMVQDPQKRRGFGEDWLRTRYPNTYNYLKHFEEILRERAAFKRYFSRSDRNGKVIETGPFYSMFDVGDYTFAPYKVVWPNIATDLCSAVIGEIDGKIILPQHIVTLVGCASENEAHYVCAAINSSCARFLVRAYSQEGGKSFGDPHVLENIRIPRFDPNNSLHQDLSILSRDAHRTSLAGEEERVHEIEIEIDRLAAQLWGLTQDELREIQISLELLNFESFDE